MISYKDLKTDRQWHSATGMNEEQFFKLCMLFEKAYISHNQVSINEKMLNLKQEFVFSTYQDCVFFFLFFLKNPMVFDNLGLVFGIDGSYANRLVHEFAIIFEKLLTDAQLMPIRQAKDLDKFIEYLSDNQDIIIDATEMSIQRPDDYQQQKDFWSGKKKRHTVKSLLISDVNRHILFLSKIVIGKTHDIEILKQEFDPNISWFKNLRVRVDLGFLGMDKLYQMLEFIIPFKRKRVKKGEDNTLTLEQKEHNKELGKQRVKVEHAIGGMKRFRVLIDRIRNKSLSFINTIVGVCAGLWNFTLVNN